MSKKGSGGAGDSFSVKLVPSPSNMSPDTEENVIGETEDVFVNFVHESWKMDSDREQFHDQTITPSVPQFTNFTSDPLSPASQVGRRLAKIGDDLNKKYQGEFDNMIDTLNVDKYTAYDTFKGVAKKLTEGNMNWGRVVALFSFGYRILWKVIGLGEKLIDFAKVVKSVVSNIVTFMTDTAQGIASWIARQGGWRSSMNYVMPSISGKLFAGICVSALVSIGVVFYLHGGIRK